MDKVTLLFAFCFIYSVNSIPNFPYKIVDLARSLHKDSPHYPTLHGFERIEELRGKSSKSRGVWVASNIIKSTEHIGTHMDAPQHFNEFSWTMNQIPLDRMIGPGVIINVKAKVAKNPDYRVSRQDLEDWEEKHGKIPNGAVILMNSGWDHNYPDKAKIWGTSNPKNTSSLHYPGWHEDAVSWLANQRSVNIIGVDSPSLDYGQSGTFPVHVIVSRENICGLENVAYLDKVPESGSIISAAAVKVVAGTGFPARVYAMVPVDTSSCDNIKPVYLYTIALLTFSLQIIF